MEPEGSTPCSQKPASGPYPEPAESNSLFRSCQRISPSPRRFETFRNKLLFYGEGLLAPRPTPKLEDHPLVAVNIFAATLRIWRTSLHPQPEEVTRDPPNMDFGP
jgi:hypothetical protein